MRPSEISLLFPLSPANAFGLGRLTTLRALAVSLGQSRRRLGDSHAAGDLAERIHDASHQILLQLFAVGEREGVEIRSVHQAVEACAGGSLGLYSAYIAGALVESEWWLDEARAAHGALSMDAFARCSSVAIRSRVAAQIDREASELKLHDWIPDADRLSDSDTPESLYMLTSPVGEQTLWVTKVDQNLLQQASAAYFVPVPEARVASRAH